MSSQAYFNAVFFGFPLLSVCGGTSQCFDFWVSHAKPPWKKKTILIHIWSWHSCTRSEYMKHLSTATSSSYFCNPLIWETWSPSVALRRDWVCDCTFLKVRVKHDQTCPRGLNGSTPKTPPKPQLWDPVCKAVWAQLSSWKLVRICAELWCNRDEISEVWAPCHQLLYCIFTSHPIFTVF